LSSDKVGAVMVVGAGIAGIQASLDLAESGYLVYLVEKTSAIGGTMPMLDKTFPTNDCSMCILSPKLVEAGRHRNIKVITLAEPVALEGEAGNFTATVRVQPRYVDPGKCKGCGDCSLACPVAAANEFNQGLNTRGAVFKRYAQAFPNAYSIEKTGLSPCRAACPAGVNAQGYVQLIKKGEFQKAWELVYESIPFPAACGRVCVHPCQTACYRAKVDEPVNIMFLKRVATDAAYADPATLSLPQTAPARPEKVAVVGAGPAGLAAAYKLALKGFPVTVFEALPVAGGMLRVGIPEYRLPKKWVDLEVDLLTRLGVEIRLGQKMGRDFQLADLRRDYQAVFIALGAHKGISLGLPGEDLPQVMQGVDFLRRVALKEQAAVGQRVAVIGGGNTAMDCARTAVRLGAAKVFIVYRRTESEITALPEEIHEAKEEGIEFLMLAGPAAFQSDGGKLTALRYVKNQLGEPDASGRRSPVPIPGSEEDLPVDTVLVAVGQQPDTACATDATLGRGRTIATDPLTLATNIPGLFAGGDVATGPKTVIEACAAGSRAAESIDRYLNGMDLAGGRVMSVPPEAIAPPRPNYDNVLRQKAVPPPEEDSSTRRQDFSEVTGPLGTAEAQKEAERCLNCGGCAECQECVRACTSDAIDHAMQGETIKLQVGSVILAPGFTPYDAKALEYYGYGRLPNVVTSLEFERILSASGPYAGHLKRPTDGREPKKIAWIQCVGSRNRKIKHGYCSSVCCMYAVKEAVIAKEHSHEGLDTTIFFMDMRTYGKGFEKYYNRAQNEYGVNFVRSRIYDVRPGVEDPSRLLIRYGDEEGKLNYQEFDMVVLSVGMEPSADAVALARTMDLPLNEYNFLDPAPLSGVGTAKPGVFVAGSFAGPRDIPETVMQASAAVGAAGSLLAESRGSLVSEQTFPAERNVAGEEPRIGVFVCNCGINIASVVNVPEVVEYARTLPNVALAEGNLYTCSQDSLVAMRNKIVENNLNRVVVASCSPRTHRGLFQETLREANLNPELFEMTNIRDQCSWVHQADHEKATAKARDLVRMAVYKAALREPVQRVSVSVTKAALVVGGGVAGLTAAVTLADQGFDVHLVEREAHLGGLALRLPEGPRGEDIRSYLREAITQAGGHERITVCTGSEIASVAGYVGNFVTTLSDGRQIKHGATILATGGEPYTPAEYLYGQDGRVVTNLELDEKMAAADPQVAGAKTVVFIQCVGSREPGRPYCSRVCCTSSIKKALKLKQEDPARSVFVLYRDVRTYGFLEDIYEEARRAGVIFIRYDADDKPKVAKVDGRLQVSVREPILGQVLLLDADLVSLAAAITPAASNARLSGLYKVPLNEDGFFLEAHMKLRPVDFASDGIYMAGVAHAPKNLEENIAQGKAAAGRASTILSREHLESHGVVAVVDPAKCAACLTCVRLCPFNAPRITNYAASIEAVLCQGCGTCAGECPNKAITLQSYNDKMFVASVDGLFEEVQ